MQFSVMEHLTEESLAHFEVLKQGLDDAGVAYLLNPRLVRGLDYYSRTVFEWVTDQLGAQGTVCAGGRFDGLVEQLGGRATSVMGFAMGLERLIVLLETTEAAKQLSKADLYLIMMGESAKRRGMLLAEELRDALPNLRMVSHCGGGGFKSQFKKADKS